MKQHVSEIQSIGLIELSEDLGHVLITPETIADKIENFFLRREINFKENKEFSDNFFVLATNRELIREKLTANIQKQFLRFPSLNIEIKGKQLIAKIYKPMTVKDTISIALILRNIFKEFRR